MFRCSSPADPLLMRYLGAHPAVGLSLALVVLASVHRATRGRPSLSCFAGTFSPTGNCISVGSNLLECVLQQVGARQCMYIYNSSSCRSQLAVLNNCPKQHPMMDCFSVTHWVHVILNSVGTTPPDSNKAINPCIAFQNNKPFLSHVIFGGCTQCCEECFMTCRFKRSERVRNVSTFGWRRSERLSRTRHCNSMQQCFKGSHSVCGQKTSFLHGIIHRYLVSINITN